VDLGALYAVASGGPVLDVGGHVLDPGALFAGDVGGPFCAQNDNLKREAARGLCLWRGWRREGVRRDSSRLGSARNDNVKNVKREAARGCACGGSGGVSALGGIPLAGGKSAGPRNDNVKTRKTAKSWE
jgi:hypothetical protein